MAVAGTLEIQLLANIARLQKDMDDAKRSVGGAMSAIEKSVGLAARAFGVLGVSVSLGALVLAAKRINDTVDAMNDLADATGASIENISALDRVARMTGANMDTVGQSLIKFNQALGTTTKAGGDAEKVLTALGLNAKTLRDLDPAEALRQTAVALSQFADDGNKARAVQELFGKSLKEVAPFLKDLAESGELVATVTAQQALEAEKFNKELFKMQANVTDAGRAIAMDLVPRLNLIIETMRGAQPVVYDFWDEWMQGLRRVTPGLALVVDLMRAQSQPKLPFGGATLNSAAGGGRGVVNPEVVKPALQLAADAAKVKSIKGLTEAEKDLIYHVEWRRKAYLEAYDAQTKADEDAMKASQAMADLMAKTMEEYAAANAKGVAEAVAAANQAEMELSTWGMLRSEVQAVTLAQLEQSRELAALAGEDVSYIEKRIAAQRRLIAATRGLEAEEENKRAAESAARDWERAAQQIEQSLTDALMNGGKSGADYIRDLFRTLVLRPLLSPIGSAMGSAIGSLPGGAAGGGGVLGSLASSGIGQIVMGGTSAFGAGLGAGFGALFGEAGITGALSAGATSIGAGNVMAGLGTIAGALGPIALGVGALASMFDSKGGPKTEGGADLAATIQQQYNGIAAQLGITNKAIFEAFYSKDPQGDSLTQLRVATLSGGRNIYERLGEENVGRSDAEFAAAVGDATMRAIIAALKDSDLSNEYKQYLNALADDASTADMQRAIDLIGQRKALDEEWLTLTSTDAENLARARKRELDAMDPTLRAIKERIWAEQDLRRESEATAAMQTRLGDALLDQVRTAESAARDAIARQDAAAVSLRRYLAALTTGPMAALSPEAQYQATRSEFMRLSSLALDDPERQGKLEEVGNAFLEASRAYNASSMAYFTDLAAVRGAVEASQVSAQTNAELGRMELNALQTSNGLLSGILSEQQNLGTTFREAMHQLYAALAGANAVNGKAPITNTGTANAVVTGLYQTMLGRAPDAEGMAYWSQRLASGESLDSVRAAMQASAEYVNSQGGSAAAPSPSAPSSTTSVVEGLYTGMLGRSSDAEGLAYWSDRLASGESLDSVRAAMQASAEYVNRINGSHANGLDYVPFDGYRAELHRGERVLTASQARGQDMGYMEMVTELRGLRAEVARLTTVSASGMQANLGKQDMIISNTAASADRALLASVRGVEA